MKLTYTRDTYCLCGAKMAYKTGDKFWDCSDILLGKAIEKGQEGSVKHEDKLPFVFYEIKEEKSEPVKIPSILERWLHRVW